MDRCCQQDIRRPLRIAVSGAITIVALTWLCGTSLPQSVAASTLSEEVRELLRNRIEAARVTPRIVIGEELIHCIQALSDFYEWRVYTPAWIDEDVPQPHAEGLVTMISQADREGLRPGYAKLRDALARYREIAAKGGWRQLPDGPTMKRGDRSEPVVALRDRIALEDNLRKELDQSTDLFDEPPEEAVRRFQRLHGLEADGVVAPKTLATLYVS